MSYSLELNTNQINIIYEKYRDYILDNTNQYVNFRFNINKSVITVYKTNKVLIQGKDDLDAYNDLCTLLSINKEQPKTFNSPITHYHSTIGSDEVGTGDFFGSVVVCAAYVPAEVENEILQLGVKDSKLLTDEKILEIAPILINKVQYSYRVLDNISYNKLYKTHKDNINLNKIKAILHNFVLNNLVNKVTGNYEMIIVDAFTPQAKYFSYLKEQSKVLENVKLIEKAEKLFTSVAIASCIARYIFLKDWERLENLYGYKLPKGAGSNVDEVAKKIYDEKGELFLSNFSKMNFKNLEKIKG